MQTILIILGVYLLYKFMVDFAIPVYKTTRRVQAQFRDMHQRATPNDTNTATNYTNSPGNQPGKVNSKDYIDFEEIKD